ncbi:LuxR C-terminal-related transcriptional regulator [Microbacterium lacus]|uniref:helix-turn-helix transcriptional regulator n=1 Tax=Microbacterium lacus TaxID=415217 RepID=UPI00384B4C21
MSVLRIAPPHAVDRPTLRNRLDVGMDAPLTLVVAPAGSGKSVLLTQWASTLDTVPVVWLEMTRADDDPVSLSRRLVGELVPLGPGFADLALAPAASSVGLGEPLLEALAASFAQFAEKVVVIFDDLHRVTNGAVVTDLWRLVDLLPSNAHFIFSSRVDLGLGWSRHRLQHGLVELRQADLAFDACAASEVLTRITRRPIDANTAESVVEHTEGWAAGVQLYGLGLRFRSDPAQFLDALADSERLVIDYLSEEVLDAQCGSRRDALLALSVLDEFTPSLIEAVAGVDDGAAFLADLEKESMFVTAVAGKPGSYRFHQLFRDLLRYRLRAMDADAEGSLLLIASRWYLAHGEIEPAVGALLAARHWDDAIDLILSRGREVYERGQTATVARWLGAIPEHHRLARPDAQVIYAILRAMSGDALVAEAIVRELLAEPDLDAGIRVIAQSYFAGLVQFLPHPDVYLAAGRKALEMLADFGDEDIPDLLNLTDRVKLDVFARASVGRAYFLLGDTRNARRYLGELLASPGPVYAPYKVHVLGTLALAEAWDGHLRRAAALADEALEMARQLELLSHPAPADAYLARSLIAIKRGEPESGAFALHEGYQRAASNGRTQLMWIAHAEARLVDPDSAESMTAAPSTPPPPLVRDALEAISRRQQREAGHPAPPSNAATWSRVAYEDIAGLLAVGDTASARARMERLTLPDPLPPSVFIDVKLLSAWQASLQRRVPESRDFLRSALLVAEREQLVQPFRRAGNHVMGLVRELPEGFAGFRRLVLERGGMSAPSPSMDGLAEPLTARELELLAYLPSRLTNAELAARCFVSLNTVKTHMAHIYRKLGTPGRDAAIIRARELGLLDAAEIARIG